MVIGSAQEIGHRMQPRWLMYLGLVLGGVTAILFVLGYNILGVISAIITGVVFALYGVTSQT